MDKIVEVIIKKVVTYNVDGVADDETAKEVVKARMDQNAPLGIIEETETIDDIVVCDNVATKHEEPEDDA